MVNSFTFFFQAELALGYGLTSVFNCPQLIIWRTKFSFIDVAFRIKGAFIPVCNFQDEYIKIAPVMITESHKMSVEG